MYKFLTLGVVVACGLSVVCSSCYRMPTAEEYSLIPSTNNPDFTREKGSVTPGVGY